MKFHLVDTIESLTPGERIVTRKNLSLAEEYLADHFPSFPVLPGVMMLEAMTQSAAWLVRVAQDFSRSIVVLASARNVRYGHFVAPGNTLRCDVSVKELGEDISKFAATALVGDEKAVTAKLELRSYNLVDTSPWLAESDAAIIGQSRDTFSLIGGPVALGEAASAGGA
jgi:3-hydroxyacyl-[acyl-carrier-protein] dehydratase